jgi:deoxyribonuclease V
MILAVDVFYYNNKAKAAGLIFKNWTDSKPVETKISYSDKTEEYVSGDFYKRELPPILNLLGTIDMSGIELVIIDGYVYISDNEELGLGGYLFEHLDRRIPVIGIAKTSFAKNKKKVREIYRGVSKNPLYISSIGIDVNNVASFVRSMHGEHRMPTLLRLLDQETRNI